MATACKYRKKPLIIEAIQLTDIESLPDLAQFLGKGICASFNKKLQYIEIDTFDGTVKANVGDYIIRDIHGEIYPCKADIFAETYDLITE